MVCANVLLTIAAVLIFIFAVWPGGIAGEVTTQWILGISAVVILIVTWTGVKCSYCKK